MPRLRNQKRTSPPTFIHLLTNITQTHNQQFYDNGLLVFKRVLEEAIRQNIPNVSFDTASDGTLEYLIDSIEFINLNLNKLCFVAANDTTPVRVRFIACQFDTISMDESNFNGEFIAFNCQFKSLSMQSSSFQLLDIDSAIVQNYNINCMGSYVANLQFDINSKSTGLLNFDDTVIESGDFAGSVNMSLNNSSVTGVTFINHLKMTASHSNFTNVFFLGKLINSDFSFTTWVDTSAAEAINCNFSNASLNNSNQNYYTFTGVKNCTFDSVTANGASFDDVSNSTFIDARLQNCRVDNPSSCQFTGAQIKSSTVFPNGINTNGYQRSTFSDCELEKLLTTDSQNLAGMNSINNDFANFRLTLEDGITYEECTLENGLNKIPNFFNQNPNNLPSPQSIGCNLGSLALGIGSSLVLAGVFFTGLYCYWQRKTEKKSEPSEKEPLKKTAKNQNSSHRNGFYGSASKTKSNEVELQNMAPKSGAESLTV